MIAKHEAKEGHPDVWAKLAAPLPAGVIAWRQDGRPVARDGKFFARFVAYIEANTVRERLDSVVPGEWNLTLELLPPATGGEDQNALEATPCAFKARLQILGVVREDVGAGRDYKQASTDAFKRAAVRFGIAHELYAYEQNWVQLDGDGKYAKPIEDPQTAYDRRLGRAPVSSGSGAPADETPARELTLNPRAPLLSDVPPCRKCGGRMWDNRIGKRNPKAPDFKCRDRSCDGVIWPPKNGAARTATAGEGETSAPESTEAAPPVSLALGDDTVPF